MDDNIQEIQKLYKEKGIKRKERRIEDKEVIALQDLQLNIFNNSIQFHNWWSQQPPQVYKVHLSTYTNKNIPTAATLSST